jgi:hypothetical protein
MPGQPALHDVPVPALPEFDGVLHHWAEFSGHKSTAQHVKGDCSSSTILPLITLWI